MGNPVSTTDIAYAENVLAKQLTKRNLANWQFAKFATLSENIPKQEGETVRWRGYAALSTTRALTALTQGVTPLGQTPTYSDVTATVAEYGDYILFNNVYKITHNDKSLQHFNMLLSEQSSEVVDLLARNVLVAGTNIRRANGVATRAEVASVIDGDDIKKSVRTMRIAKAKAIRQMLDGTTKVGTVPIDESYIAFCSSYVEYDLLNITGFIPVKEYSSKQDVIKGEIGSYAGVRFIREENSTVYTGLGDSSRDVHAVVILAQNAYGLVDIAGMGIQSILKPIGTGGTDRLNQRGSIGWKMFFAGAIINENNILRLEVGVTA